MRSWHRATSVFVALILMTAAGPAFGQLDDTQINERLGLTASQRILLGGVPNSSHDPFTVSIPFDGDMMAISLAPHSTRAAQFKIVEEYHPGLYRELTPQVSNTLRGNITGEPSSVVAAALLDDGLYIHIAFSDGSHFGVEPLARFGDAPDAYALFDHADVVGPDAACLVLNPAAGGHSARRRISGGPSPCPPGGLHMAELAIDADYEYFQDHGDVDTVTSRIEAIVNAANVQYERDVSITHMITAIMVRTTASDPYTTSDAEGLLRQLTDHWNAQQVTIDRDVTQLFTGRNLIGSTVGVAWLGNHSVCGTDAYGVVESDYNGIDGNFACKSDLTAHELGHNWNAPHCSCTQYTMNPSMVSCNNQFHPSFTIPDITGYRNTRTCLSVNDEPATLEHLTIEAPSYLIAEGGSLALRVVADLPEPPCTADADVTTQVVWTVEPTSAGTVDTAGVFSASPVDVDTIAVISAFYDGVLGQGDAELLLTIENASDAEGIVIDLTPVPGSQVVVGQTIDLDVRLSTSGGELQDIRLLQFDTATSTGVSNMQWAWDFETIDDGLYDYFADGDIHSAVFGPNDSVPGFIVTVTPTPRRVARLQVHIDALGTVSVRGPASPATVDEGVSFLAGFVDPMVLRSSEGNVSGGTLLLTDLADETLQIVSSHPPGGSIDAREPSTTDGWSSLTVDFNDNPAQLTAADFTIDISGIGTTPQIAGVTPLGGNQLLIEFDTILPVGAWTQVHHVASGSMVRLGVLPADVDADGTSNSLDLLILIDHLNGIGDPPPSWSTDINRSGTTEPLDILRTVDLLNGAGAFDPWNGRTLP
jgi:hypothetical protein